ncbi:MAG: nicotinate (nicotinamide) nucleotide adenylyltransferase [Candidatus Dormibacteria bacterium]
MATRSGVVFGGTFDPVHRGHLEVIRGLRRELGLPVLVVPNGNPPHRLPPLASGPERLLMVQLALAELEDPLVETSEVELNRPGLSYTADTLAELAAADPERELLLALGSDAARGLPDWERPGLVLGRARLVVFDRLGTENRGSDVLTQLRRLGWPLPGAMAIHVAAPEVDSSEIRWRLRQGDSCPEWLPAVVSDEIAERGLYGWHPRTQRSVMG